MGWLARLVHRIDAKVDRPADQSVLDNPSGESDTPEQAVRSVRRSRNRTRERWLGR